MVRLAVAMAVLLGNLVPAMPAAAQQAHSAVCQPREGKNPCESCHEKNCCVERRACENDPACSAFLNCLRTSCPTPPCNTQCGTAPRTYVARFVCQMSKCNEAVCGGPVDACTLCTNTRCAAESLACQGKPGCGDLLGCAAACGQDTACKERCRKTHAGSAAVAEAQTACVRKQCGKECP